MDSNVYLNKAHGTNMRVTRQATKQAARAIEQKERPTKRKRRRENETSVTATNGSQDQMEAKETDEDERSPNKIRKVSGEGEETSDGEEDMEVKEGEENEEGDQDQDMTEGEDEEDSSSHVQDGEVKTSAGEPVTLDRNVFSTSVYKDTDGAHFLRSRRSIHSENQGNEVYSKGMAGSSPGMVLRYRENQTETHSPRTGITHYKEQRVLTKPNLASQRPYSLPREVTSNRPYVMRQVCQPNSVPPLKRTSKGGKKELPVKNLAKTASYSFFEGWFWKLLLFVLISVCAILLYLFSRKQAPVRVYVVAEGFQARFLDVVSSFPSQRAELWKRSKIHLERHLQTAEPTEPVSMILTSGRGAEGTLRCLATRMAAAFSSALGASVLHIDGASRATLESDQVKLDIDEQLKGAFEGNQKAAVVHRFEELPPGSTLIFYRYCDHENAAYKKVLVVFTVQLPTHELSPQLSLNTVEEMVQEHIQSKFLMPSQSVSYDQMDTDKLSGLWSRISHLILPVAAEQHFEQQGCDI